MEEEIDNGIALLEGILQNWKNENKGKEYYIFFPRCVKENGKNIVLFPIFEEGKNNTVKLKVWGKYCLETYTLEEYLDATNVVVLSSKRFINYKKKKYIQNIVDILNIFYVAQSFMNVPEESIEYIANQELLEEKIDEFKEHFKTILTDEDLGPIYGVKKAKPKPAPVVTKIPKIEVPKAEELTIKKLQQGISKVEVRKAAPTNYMLKLMEKLGDLSSNVGDDKRMKSGKIKGTVEESIADVLYYTCSLANTYGIDLEECIYLKEEIESKKHNRKNMFKD